MSTLAEIEAAIAELPPEEWKEVFRWMDENRPNGVLDGSLSNSPQQWPDFLGRQDKIFGSRFLPDSQAILDEIRCDRF